MQKKLLIVTKTLLPFDGQGRYSLSLIKELKKYYHLTILVPKNEISFDFFPQNQEIKIVKIDNLFQSKNFVGLIKYFFITLFYLFKIDFFHFFTDLPNYLIFSAVFWLKLKPYFMTAHGTYGVSYFKKSWQRFFLKKIYQKAKKVICVSHFTEKEILSKVKLQNTMVINNGVDFDKWQLKSKIKKREDKMILSVGSLKSRKGYHISILAIAKVMAKYKNLKYYIIGSQEDKKYFNQLKDLVKKYHLEENVIFKGNVSDKELVDLYHLADLFLLSSVNIDSKFEGFGLVFLEAGAAGLPSVGTLNCGIEDAIVDKETGFLVPQKDTEALVEAILKILESPRLAKTIGEKAKKRAAELDWFKVAWRYMEVYKCH